MKQKLAGVLIILAVAVAGYWFQAGAKPWTATKVLIETSSKDDFGDTVITREWKSQFVPGGMDFALPVGGGLTGVAALLLFLDWRAKKKKA